MRDNPILPSGSSGDDQVPARRCVVGDNDGDRKDDGDVEDSDVYDYIADVDR